MKMSKGFTLIEMLITVAIIGVLAAIAVPSYQKYIESTHITAAKTALVKYGQLMTRWKLENGTFAKSSTKGNVWPITLSNDNFYAYSFKPATPGANTEIFEIMATPKSNNNSKKFVFIDQDGNTKVCTDSAATSCE